MPYSCELPSVERREMILLSIVYRMLHGKGDRNPEEAKIGATRDPVTGIVKSAADLKAPGLAIRGKRLVRQQSFQPDMLALTCLTRDDGTRFDAIQVLKIVTKQPDPEDPEKPREVYVFECLTSEKSRAEEELLRLKKDHPEWEPVVRLIQGREALTEEEAQAASDLTDIFEDTFRAFADRGWLVLKPPVLFDPAGPESLPAGPDASKYKTGVADDGSIFQAHFTNDGIEEAERRVRGDPYWSRQAAFSLLEGASQDVKAAAVQNVPWANRLFKDGT
jgi:hypothetical protein